MVRYVRCGEPEEAEHRRRQRCPPRRRTTHFWPFASAAAPALTPDDVHTLAGLSPVASQIAAVSTFALALTAFPMSLDGSASAAAIPARLLPASSSGLKLAPDETYFPAMFDERDAAGVVRRTAAGCRCRRSSGQPPADGVERRVLPADSCSSASRNPWNVTIVAGELRAVEGHRRSVREDVLRRPMSSR